MKVLIVKLSSMGDLVQALPALTDARNAIPGIEFDWAVDEAFAEIPSWHPAVNDTLKTAHRRWKKNLGQVIKAGELGQFKRELQSTTYDKVIDAQGNIKSALVTGLARGSKYGYNKATAHEFGAHWAYDHHFHLPRQQLAIDRLRKLFSQSLGYPLPTTEPDFGLDGIDWPAPSIELPTRPFLVLVHNASWTNKCWPEHHWQQLIEMTGAQGFDVLLPWGSRNEHERAQRLAADFDHATVLPRLPLTQLASIFTRSAGAICVDTGLAHMAAALDVPTVTLYGPTDPALIGATGPHATQLMAQGFACIPCYKRFCQVDEYKGPDAKCLDGFAAEQVWEAFEKVREQTIQLPG